MSRTSDNIVSLLGINIVYACVSVFTKMASEGAFLSAKYVACMGGAVAVMAVYAVLWQAVLKRVPLAEAYMFKGSSLVFVLLLSALLFGEIITWGNVAGAMLIVGGIALCAKN